VLYVVLIVMLVALGFALWWGARKSRDTDEDIKYMNEGRGVGRGILGVFGRGRNDRD
jgi:Na+/proline symporter